MPQSAPPEFPAPASPADRAAQPAQTGPSRRTRVLLIAAVAIAIAVAVGFYLYYLNRESTDDAEIEGHIESVAPRVSGTVSEVDVNDYQIVKPGQVLFRLDDRDYRAALEQAEANLQAAQAAAASARTGVPITAASSGGTLSGAEAGLREAQSGETLAEKQAAAARAQVNAAAAQTTRAQADAENATTTERRYAQLVGKQEVSQLQYDQVATQAKAAAAAEQAAEAQQAAAEQQLASANAQIQVARDKVAQAAAVVRSAATAPEQLSVSRAQARTAEARVAQAEAAVAQAQLNLDYTVVTAPTGGQVGNKHLELGQTFAAGQTALDIVPINDVWVIANFKETQLEKMRNGQPADVSVDAFGTTLKAKVDYIGAGTGAVFSLLPPENATGNYVKVVQRVPVKLIFDQGQDLSRLRPGMSVEATVFINK